MKKVLLITSLIISISFSIFAQNDKPKDPNYTNYYKEIPPIVTDACIITFEDVVSKMGYCKLKIRIKNTTTDYILFRSTESAFKLPQGDFSCTNKPLVIKPLDSDFKVLDIKADGKCLVDSFALLIRGIYRFSSTEEVQPTPNFNLPPSANTFNNSAFQCTMLNIKKETQETWVKFDCKYLGDNAGIIDPNKTVVRLETGQEFANGRSNMKQVVLFKGETDKFSLFFNVPATIANMQLANMQIAWKNAFLDSPMTLYVPQTVSFVIDSSKTQAKNKK